MPSAGQVIEAYLTLREQKTALAALQKEEMAPINEKMTKLETYMLDLLNKANVDSMAFKGVGTMFKKMTSSVTVEEWDATLDWIRTNEVWELLERRVSKTVAQEYADSHGEYPPGLKVVTDVVVQVRKT
jgi:hypothetical protein